MRQVHIARELERLRSVVIAALAWRDDGMTDYGATKLWDALERYEQAEYTARIQDKNDRVALEHYQTGADSCSCGELWGHGR